MLISFLTQYLQIFGMFFFKAFLSIVLIALSTVDASPLRREVALTLGFTTRMNARANDLNIAAADRARAQAMLHAGTTSKRASSSSFSIANAVVCYTTQVGVGSPATQYTLLIDTGSSNTWVGVRTAYKVTSTSVDTGHTVTLQGVRYGSGSFSGEEYLDTVTLSSDLIIAQQSIGSASETQGFSHLQVDGILGVGPADLTQGTVSDVDTVPTVTDNLYSKADYLPYSQRFYSVFDTSNQQVGFATTSSTSADSN
ncbi:acid protease [Suillus decipiens]|nr:acid protease [Suillus decipiens]